MTTLQSPTITQKESINLDYHNPLSFSAEDMSTTELYLPKIFTIMNDSEQVETSVQEQTVTSGSRPVFVLRLNNSSINNQTPSATITIRPYRSFQHPQWSTSTRLPTTWVAPDVVQTTFKDQHHPSTTLSWYSIHNSRNTTYPQMNQRPDYDWHSRPSDHRYDKGSTEFPPRVHYTDNYHGREYDPGLWTHRNRQFGENNMSSYDMRNNWNIGHQREGYMNRPPPTTNRDYPYRGEGWNYQNPRQNWNWEARYRTPITPMNFPYRPYQNTDPNYRQPIALPPIQLPPLYDESSRPMQGANSVGHRQFIREGILCRNVIASDLF